MISPAVKGDATPVGGVCHKSGLKNGLIFTGSVSTKANKCCYIICVFFHSAERHVLEFQEVVNKDMG
ncbi:MAG: hypothetical protein ACD_62C00178G0001 [uncultured bacterium]|nr:MAG: hypothetical protein ACD_62C00178G0001 [uncultured bacterium]